MKKTLVALAALTTVGAAFAQSSVTLYGKIDWEIQSFSTRTAAGVTTNPGLRVQSAGLQGSRFGMKGSEDLGGGMSAIFDLQGGINVDTGQTAQCGSGNVVSVNACGGTFATPTAAAGVAPGVTIVNSQGPRIFGRTAYAGLKGGFGQITAGRQYAPFDNAFGVSDAQGYTTNSAMGAVFNAGGHADAGGPGRIDNSVTYYTPAMGGFNAQLMWAPGENKSPGVQASRYTGIGLGYANGPINIQFANENMKSNGFAGVGAITPAVAGVTPTLSTNSVNGGVAGTTNAWIIGGSYDFGVVKPFLAYERASNAINTRDRGWSLGAAVPIGTANFQIGYARERSNPVVGATTTSRGFGGQLSYPLSKRTFVYTEALMVRASTAGVAGTARTRTFGVGMQHNF